MGDSRVTAREEQELRALVYQAFELRETPYLADACTAIVDWFGRLPLTRSEREQEHATRV
jgi:hypothetical protein